MKNLFTSIAMLILTLNPTLYAQEQETIATFEIGDARDNGNDITPKMLEATAYLVLYKLSNIEEVQLANFWEKQNSQSFGSIYSIVKEEFPESDENFKSEIFNFYWSYNNSYDDIKGTAKIKLLVIYKPRGTYFEFTIIPENLDELIYKGSMKGDLTMLDDYLKK